MLKPVSLNSTDRIKKRKLNTSAKRKFGINADQYEAMLMEQNKTCAICKNQEEGRALAIDHCHTTNEVRGLLCSNCNTALGKFKDSVELLKNAIEYLERDYQVPVVCETLKPIQHDDRPNWKMLVYTPDGLFPSLKDAGDFYKTHDTTVRSWCLPNSKWKKDGFSCQKLYISKNQLKDYCDEQNKSI